MSALTGTVGTLRKAETVSMEAVEEDQSEEIEALMSTFDIEDRQSIDLDYLRAPPESAKQQKVDYARFSENLKKASENVVLIGTHEEYNRLWRQFKEFTARLGYVKQPDDIETYGKNVPAAFPQWISIWIMDK
ncbi:hypothetical protein A0H81_06467 [Grifola frondosa]|uniref:Uncharacterized protein n=1 Tax=Grifola frondosa TaxID=5627 RepID=A0A1C7MB22_GRIFR|nr:hypothetical protein A0H81_06467 [Grifola frondosa]